MLVLWPWKLVCSSLSPGILLTPYRIDDSLAAIIIMLSDSKHGFPTVERAFDLLLAASSSESVDSCMHVTDFQSPVISAPWFPRATPLERMIIERPESTYLWWKGQASTWRLLIPTALARRYVGQATAPQSELMTVLPAERHDN